MPPAATCYHHHGRMVVLHRQEALERWRNWAGAAGGAAAVMGRTTPHLLSGCASAALFALPVSSASPMKSACCPRYCSQPVSPVQA